MATEPHPQLLLPVAPADYATFENFHPAGNDTVLRVLQNVTAPSYWLHGAAGCGKSHLLQAVCASDERSAYTTGQTLIDWPPEGLDGFERFEQVCIDDVHRVLGDREREVALFHLFNRLQDRGGTLLLAAPQPPVAYDFALADLGSRLRASVALRVDSLDDDGAIAALKLRAGCRGFEMPAATARYLLSHYQRDMGSLCRLLDQLDTASLAAQRKLTVPFVKTIL
ncbi:MAG: DnaA regulatory inactivator Hda [Gammaproteobacteria bacterium]